MHSERGPDALAQLSDDGTAEITDAERTQRVLDALEDPDCRAVLEATRTEELSVNEIAETCDLAQSTAYRKVDRLLEAALLEEDLRIRESGAHVNTYRCRVCDVHVSLEGDGGVALEVGVDGHGREPHPSPEPLHGD